VSGVNEWLNTKKKMVAFVNDEPQPQSTHHKHHSKHPNTGAKSDKAKSSGQHKHHHKA